MRARVRLTADSPHDKRLEINARHIPGVTNVDISVNADGIPTATITLLALAGLFFDGDAEVTLKAETEETLRMLGWTKTTERPGSTDGGLIGGKVHGTREPLPKIVGHEQVIHPDGRIMCEPIYQHPSLTADVRRLNE